MHALSTVMMSSLSLSLVPIFVRFGHYILPVRAHDIVGIILIEVGLTTSWASCIVMVIA